MWEKETQENFLDPHFLYRAVPKNLYLSWTSLEKIDPNFFYSKNAETGLSFDWSKYSSPKDTLNRRNKNSLKENGIMQMNIGNLRRSITEFDLPITFEHDPLPDNRSHTLLLGITKGNKTKIRRKLSKIAEWALGMNPLN